MFNFMWNPVIRRKAINLRKQGYTYAEIKAQISGLPKGTLSGWCDGIVLTKAEKQKIFKRATHALERARILASATLHKKRIERERCSTEEAKRIFAKRKNDTLFLLGVILYWAEGTKSGSFQFMNSDPRLVRLMIRWLIDVCDVPKNMIKVRLYTHKIFVQEHNEVYWRRILSFLPKENFQKTVYKSTPHKIKRNPEYRGCLRVEVLRIDLLRKMKYYFELISKEYSLD